MKSRLFFLSALVMLCCTSFNLKASKYNQAKNDSVQKSKIIIANDIEKKIIFFSMSSTDNSGLTYEKKVKNDTILFDNKIPLDITILDVLADKTLVENHFILYPNEEVILKKDSITKVISASNDEIRNNELSFFSAYISKMGYYKSDRATNPFRQNENINIRLFKIKALYLQRMEFLEEYVQKHPVRTKFKERISAIFFYHQYLNFFYKYSQDNDFSSELLKSELVTQFIDDLKPNDSHIDMDDYAEALYMISMYETLKNGNDLSQTNIFEHASKTYNNVTRDILLYKILGEGVGNGEKNLIARYDAIVENPFLKEQAKITFGMIVEKENYQSTEFLAMKSGKLKETNLDSICKGSINYVDFWASWCGECQAEMPHSMALRAEYSKKGINFVYLSADDNPFNWEKAMKLIGLTEAESYLLRKGAESEIANEFNISSIPHYMIMDEKGKVINSDAPRPSDPKIKKIFDELLKKE